MTRSFVCFILLCFLTSCDRDEPIPSYIDIDTVALFTEPEIEGANSHAISEISVSAEGQNLGIYALPAEIPVLEEGLTDVTISAIIRQNGLDDQRVVYPHYDFLTYTVNLNPTEIHSIQPIFTYRDVSIDYQNFDTFISFNSEVNSEGYFERTTDSNLTFGGSGGSAISILEDNGSVFYAETDEGYFWPSGQPVFLEIDYSCNQSFVIGAKATTGIEISRTELLVVLPTQNTNTPIWKKLYVNLTNFVFDNNNATEFEIFFTFNKTETNPVVYLDNLKVIHP